MVEEQPNRAERRRQEREQPKQDEKDYGPVYPRTYDKCPVCGCPARFTMEAMKGDKPEDILKSKPPALGALEYKYSTPTHDVKLVVVYDTCVRCGALFTIARDKKKSLRLSPSKFGPTVPLIGR